MQKKTDAKLNERNAGQEHVKEEIKASKVALKEEMRAWPRVMKNRRETMMKACLEKTKITDLDTNPKETVLSRSIMKSLMKRPKWKLEDRRGDRHLAVGHRRQPKWTRRWWIPGEVHRRMTHRTIPARRKGRGHKEPTVEKKRRKRQQCCTGNPLRTNVRTETSEGAT
jgi:hypothetical protein